MNRKLLFLVVSTTLMGSSPSFAGDSTILSTGIGAALGGYLGSHIGKGEGQLAATGAGVFLGGLMGNSVGRSMDRANSASYAPSYSPYYQPMYEPAYVAPPAAPVPQVIYVQPEVVEYEMPTRTVYVDGDYVGPRGPHGRHGRQGQHCREFTQTIRIDGRVHESYGTACLRPDGSWQIEQ